MVTFSFHVPYLWSAHKIIEIQTEAPLANAHAINQHCQRERVLLDAAIWIVIAEIIPVCDHSLQGLGRGGQQTLESAVAA